MTVDWRHRIVRVLDDETAITNVVLGLVDDGWILVGRGPSEPGRTDLVFRRARFANVEAFRSWARRSARGCAERVRPHHA